MPACPLCAKTGLVHLAERHHREPAGGRQELSGTTAQCLNLEQEMHHIASKLCILGFEPLK
jgi:hypothetical protein